MAYRDVVRFSLSVLGTQGFPFAVIGSVAGYIHGAKLNRGFKDIDYLIVLPPDRVDSLLKEIASQGLPIQEVPPGRLKEKLKKGFPAKIKWHKRKFSFDIVPAITKFHEYAIETSVIRWFDVAEVDLPVVRPEPYAAYKIMRKWLHDWWDVIELIKAMGDDLDWDEIRRLVFGFADETGDERAVPNFFEFVRLMQLGL